MRKRRQELTHEGDTLASTSQGARVAPEDGMLPGLKYLSPGYANGVEIYNVGQPKGFDGKIPDPLHYRSGGESLKGSYGKKGKK